ncbi:MAG: hypothetical protein QXZ70_00465 [Candidatus Bathyarchaeia archaeon]
MIPEEKVVEIVNDVNDNLWLGDVIEVRKLADMKWIEEFNVNRIRYNETVLKFRSQYSELRSRLKQEHKGFDFRFALSKQFREMIQEEELDPKDAVIGSVLEYFEKLQARLQSVGQIREIVHKDKYKYAIQGHAHRYEVRALLGKEQEVNIEKMVKELSNMGFHLSKIDISKPYVLFMAFSDQAYVEIMVFVPRVSIIILFLSPDLEKAEQLAKTMVDSLLI